MSDCETAKLERLIEMQLNPEERLNGDLKQEMSKRVPVRTAAKLHQGATEHMTMLEQTPERVIDYFLDRHIKFAD